MYIGRIVTIGLTESGDWFAGYRVSSRSFPGRRMEEKDQRVLVVDTEGAENRFISYCAMVTASDHAVVGNGTHVDIISDQLTDGVPIQHALVNVLNGMGFEHDHLGTPRITGVIVPGKHLAYLGIVAPDRIHVEKVALDKGQVQHLATYEHNSISDAHKNPLAQRNDPTTARTLANMLLEDGHFAEFANPVCACATLAVVQGGFSIGVSHGDDRSNISAA